ncbi:hypothetical protein PVK06_041055 [Gossypium arboreum]|uniref:Mevalonate kinase n=1 Tax=Gossypium arboreum TaxID=29729 RepID=A0ABR0NA05_GOSAR|nr:hypothetical protein PVK06_041055 [Gossypium arboreum]
MDITTKALEKVILASEHAVVHRYTAIASSIDLYIVVFVHFFGSTPLFSSTPILCSLETVKSITSLVDEQSFPETRIGLASGVCAFLWLYTSILGFKPGTVIVTSELPLGAALGSSVAYCVALSADLPAFSDSMKLDMSQKEWLMLKKTGVGNGVTHASKETILQIVMKYKLASKLTGAGGGGCVLTFT